MRGDMGWLIDRDGRDHVCWAYDLTCPYCPGSFRVFPNEPRKPGRWHNLGEEQAHDCTADDDGSAYPPRYKRTPLARGQRLLHRLTHRRTAGWSRSPHR